MYMLIPNSSFILSPFSPWVTISWCSKSVTYLDKSGVSREDRKEIIQEYLGSKVIIL